MVENSLVVRIRNSERSEEQTGPGSARPPEAQHPTNARQILSVFFQSLFAKTFVSYSSDVISLLAGLDKIDGVFPSFLSVVNTIIHDCPVLSIRVLAIRTTTVIAGGVYQTSLATYFLHKNLFASIMKFIADDEGRLYVGDAFSLLGILASYDKLEGLNPYQVRFSDFVDNSVMLRIIQASGYAWNISLDKYTSGVYRGYLLGDSADAAGGAVGGSITGFGTNIVSWIGGGFSELGSLIWKRPNGESAKDALVDETEPNGSVSAPSNEDNEIPHATISILLAIYEFIHSNKVFCRLLIETKGAKLNNDSNNNNNNNNIDNTPPPFTLFISLTSYLLQNQHKSVRANNYSRLSLLILRILVEDSSIISNQLLNEDLKSNINLCRLRNPPLPWVNDKIFLLHGILDSLIGCIRFNMKRTIDYEMYNLTLIVLFQIISSLRNLKIRINYHWQETWKSLLTFIKFLNTHPPKAATTATNEAAIKHTVDLTLLILSTLLIHGETILYDNHQYDDLFYRIIESASEFKKLESLYQSTASSSSITTINKLISHYQPLLPTDNNISYEQVVRIIKQGNQSLSLYRFVSELPNSSSKKYLLYDNLPIYKESDERLFLKKITRLVITDVQSLYKI